MLAFFTLPASQPRDVDVKHCLPMRHVCGGPRWRNIAIDALELPTSAGSGRSQSAQDGYLNFLRSSARTRCRKVASHLARRERSIREVASTARTRSALQNHVMSRSTPQAARHIHRIVRDLSGNPMPRQCLPKKPDGDVSQKCILQRVRFVSALRRSQRGGRLRPIPDCRERRLVSTYVVNKVESLGYRTLAGPTPRGPDDHRQGERIDLLFHPT